MSILISVAIPGILAVALLAANIFLTYEALRWVPFSVSKRLGVCALIWLLPVVGAVIAARLLKLAFFKRTAYSGGATGAGLMEADAIFNPQARHYIEYKHEKASVVLQTEQADDGQKIIFSTQNKSQD